MTLTRKKYHAGWRNNYRETMPFFERLLKDIKFALLDFLLWIRNGFQSKVIVVYPDFPSKKTTIFKIAKSMGYRLTNKPVQHAEVVIYFDDITAADANLPDTLLKDKVVNIRCTDISKVKVDEVHLAVFRYNTIIEPETYSGIAVQKSDINAMHDGKVIHCPIQTKRDSKSVYQVLIDNQVNDQLVMDYRVPVYHGHIPLLYCKYKSMEKRFTNDVSYSELVEDVASVFSETEIQQIQLFTQVMEVEFCELDILRNKTDGRIYIIDVNKTPYGPPAGLKLEEQKTAVHLLTAAFQKHILSNFSRIN